MADQATIPDEQELARIVNDPIYTIETYFTLRDERGLIVPAHLWDHEKELIRCLEERGWPYILKARQIGITWTMVEYLLYCAIFRPGFEAICVSINEPKAKRLKQRMDRVFSLLPQWMKEIPVIIDNQLEMAWEHGSALRFSPSTSYSSTGETPTVLFIDEAAYIMNLEEMLGNAIPALEKYGQIVVVSTGEFIGDPFHVLWDHASKGDSRFTPIFFPWNVRPDRTREWWLKQRDQFPNEADFLKAYPATPEQAFKKAGAMVFDYEAVIALRPEEPWIVGDLADDNGKVVIEQWDRGYWKFYRLPIKGNPCSIGADEASGPGSFDYFTAVVTDCETGAHIMSIRCKIEPEEFAGQLILAARFCEQVTGETCIIVPEAGAYGKPVISHLVREGDGLLIYRQIFVDSVRRRKSQRYGFTTTPSTKPLAIVPFARAIKLGRFKTTDEDLYRELLTYIVYPAKAPGAREKMGAVKGQHDDMVMAAALSWVGVEALSGRDALMGTYLETDDEDRSEHGRAVVPDRQAWDDDDDEEEDDFGGP